MSRQVEEAIIKYLEKVHQKSLLVTWYGGEPLMNARTIERIANSINGMSKFENVQYGIITNGYLLNKEKAELLKKTGVSSIQVTIDGPPHVHNATRIHKSGKPTFDVIVKNIDAALKVMTDAHFKIRVNVDEHNQDGFPLIYKMLNERWESKVSIYPGYIQDHAGCGEGCFTSRGKVRFLSKLSKEHGIKVNFFPIFNNGVCGSVGPSSLLVGPDGKLYKCWVDLEKEDRMVGSILDPKVDNPLSKAKSLFENIAEVI